MVFVRKHNEIETFVIAQQVLMIGKSLSDQKLNWLIWIDETIL